MSPNSGDNDTTQDQTSSACIVVLTTASGHSSVRGGYDDGEQATDSTDSGDGDLSANRFDIDGEIPDSGDGLDRDGVELQIDHAEKVARLWDTPKGEWWP